jgi:hypothetical protein
MNGSYAMRDRTRSAAADEVKRDVRTAARGETRQQILDASVSGYLFNALL